MEEVLKVCENHPESLVGKSPIRDVEDVEENSGDDEWSESGVEARGRSERVRGLGIEGGSTITGASPTSVGEKGVADDDFLSFSLSLSFIPRNLLVFRVLAMGIEDCGNSGDGDAAELRLARVLRLPAGSVTDLGPSRFDCF